MGPLPRRREAAAHADLNHRVRQDLARNSRRRCTPHVHLVRAHRERGSSRALPPVRHPIADTETGGWLTPSIVNVTRAALTQHRLMWLHSHAPWERGADWPDRCGLEARNQRPSRRGRKPFPEICTVTSWLAELFAVFESVLAAVTEAEYRDRGLDRPRLELT